MNANPQPLENLDAAWADLKLITSLRQRKRCLKLREHHDADWVSELICQKVEVTREHEAATNDTPEFCEYSFDYDESEQLILDASICEWQPEEGQTYYVDLFISGIDEQVKCRWSVKHFSAAISPKLWLLTVEFCEE